MAGAVPTAAATAATTTAAAAAAATAAVFDDRIPSGEAEFHVGVTLPGHVRRHEASGLDNLHVQNLPTIPDRSNDRKTQKRF